jgi:hypothetical protein
MAKSLKSHPYILPGEYDGVWSAYFVVVILNLGIKSEPIKLDEGVKGINCKCKVTVDELGWLNVK